MKKSLPITLIIATRNSHKVGEICAILSDRFRYLTLNDFLGAPIVIEDASTFVGNATKKATELANWLSESPTLNSQISNPDRGNVFVLADDSGLEVDALNGEPGIYSARFAAMSSNGNSLDAANNEKLLRLLEKIPAEKRTARFRCAVALTPVVVESQENSSPVCCAKEAELRTEIFEGVCEGRITFAPNGQGGFGYDPLFMPNGFEKSFAELSEVEKNKISHRAKALEKLRVRLNLP